MGQKLKAKIIKKPTRIDTLPDLALEEIFLNLAGRYLVEVVSLVCKKWKSILDNESFWLRKCLKDSCLDLNEYKKLREKGIFEYKKFYFKNVANFMLNPNGDLGLTHWCLIDYIPMDKIRIIQPADLKHLIWTYTKSFELPSNKEWKTNENEDGYVLLLDKRVQLDSYFVNSYIPTLKMQVIDLSMFFVLKKEMPVKLIISEIYSARAYCPSSYKLIVLLVDEFYQLVDSFIHEETIRFKEKIGWKKVEKVFEIKKSFQYVIYIHGGSQTYSEDGFYGSRMTNSGVKLIFC